MRELRIERRHLLAGGAALTVPGLALAMRPTKAFAAATSATQTQISSQTQVTPSIFDFGAAGDGVTDDSAAFNAALQYSASRGQMVIVPGYSYAIRQPIAWTSTADVGEPWGLLCQGATLISSIMNGQDVITLTSNNTVRYFQLSGPLKINGSGSDGCGLHIKALSSSVYFYDILIDGLAVERVGQDGLCFEGDVFESTILNSYFQDCGHNGATFAQSKGGVCSAITIIGCFFAQNGNYGMAATSFDGQYGGTTDIRVYGGYCRDNQSYGFYYNNGTSGGIEQVGFENNCKALPVGSPNGAHVYGLVAVAMRACTGYSSYGGATNLLSGWFSGLTYLDGCSNWSAATTNTYVVTVNGNSSGHVYMVGCAGGVAVAGGSSCTWEAVNCTGTSPKGALNIRGTVQNY